MSNTNEDQARADRIRGYKEQAMKSPFIRQEYVCVHPAVNRFWITGGLSDHPEHRQMILNAHFVLVNGERRDFQEYDNLNELIQDAEAYCQSLPKE